MYKVFENQEYTKGIYKLVVSAPNVVTKIKPGEFVIFMCHKTSERIPLYVVDKNNKDLTITVFYEVKGKSTRELSMEKENIYSISGPYGNASILVKNYQKIRKILFVVQDMGITGAISEVKFLKNHNIDVDMIYGYSLKSKIILEDELKSLVPGIKILNMQNFYKMLKKNRTKYDICMSFGPIEIQKNVVNVMAKRKIPTYVNMHTIILDGIGMCGSCKIVYDNEIKLSCIDGPEFDGSKIDFNKSIKRNKMYQQLEKVGYKRD